MFEKGLSLHRGDSTDFKKKFAQFGNFYVSRTNFRILKEYLIKISRENFGKI